MQAERKLVKQFDKNDDKRLSKDERAAAREFLKANPEQQRGGFPGGGPGGRRGPGGPGGGGFPPRGGGEDKPVTPGQHIQPSDVTPAGSADLYAADTLRTLFLDFENADWEKELEDFHGTDVEVPATLTVDGKTYSGVGVHFRGMSSYMMVSAGHKRSLNLSLDASDKKQNIHGYKTLNLLNSNGDGSFLSGVLYSHIARRHIPAPKANLVRVVINGENWGVYVNQEQFSKDFIQENFRTTKGARWKVRGSPMGRGGLDYVGDDLEVYKQRYDMKSGDDEDWQALVKLCKTLSTTPPAELEAALAPMLDIDSVLWFLALDCGLMNSDGYWIRASDYSLYRDAEGRFHLIPADMNEAFRPEEGGPGGGFGRPGGGGRGGFGRPDGGQGRDGDGTAAPPHGAAGREASAGGAKLDPLTNLNDDTKPLRSKLLAVPKLRESYLAKVRTLAQEDLDWAKLGPVVAAYRTLAGKEVEADTRKNSSTEDFFKLTADEVKEEKPKEERPMRGFGGNDMPLRRFADERRAFLLEATGKE